MNRNPAPLPKPCNHRCVQWRKSAASWYCRCCNRYATPEHVRSDSHVNWIEEYGDNYIYCGSDIDFAEQPPSQQPPPAPVAPPGLVPGSPSQRQPLATPAGPALAPALHHSAPLGPPAAPLAPSGAASSGSSAPASTGSPVPLEQSDQLRGELRAVLARLQSIKDTLARLQSIRAVLARPDTGSGGAAARSAPAAETPGAGPSPGSDRPRP